MIIVGRTTRMCVNLIENIIWGIHPDELDLDLRPATQNTAFKAVFWVAGRKLLYITVRSTTVRVAKEHEVTPTPEFDPLNSGDNSHILPD